MRSYSKTIVDSNTAKLTIAATEVRVKLPSAWTDAQRDHVEQFFKEVVAEAPEVGQTLRGSISDPDRPRASMRMSDWKHKHLNTVRVK